jgi:hypothetical protein
MTNGTWHYQLMRHKSDNLYAIHEYYPEGDGCDGDGWTVNPVCVDGDSVEEVKQVLQMMLEDIEKHGVKDYD